MVLAQISLLANGFGDIIGPILIFGIFIISSIVKAAAKKGRGENGDKETESALKKAVRQRYHEIYQQQTGKAPKKPLERSKPPRYIPDKPMREIEPTAVQQRSQWELRQEAIRQRNATMQRSEYSKPTILNQIAAAAVAKPPRPKPATKLNAQTKVPRKHIQQPVKSVKHDKAQTAGVPLYAMMKDPKNLRTAFILKEILDKPIALQD